MFGEFQQFKFFLNDSDYFMDLGFFSTAFAWLDVAYMNRTVGFGQYQAA